MSEITQEQGVEIAEWLGLTIHRPETHPEQNPDYRPFWVDADEEYIAFETGPTLENWLRKSEGEVAMMDKLFENGNEISDVTFGRHTCDTIEVRILYGYEKMWLGVAPTRNAAMQLAILEMLEGE